MKYHHSQFLHRSNPAQSRLAELIETVADVNELTKLIQHGKKIYSAADESRRNNLRAGDELFKNNTDSALIRERSAQEMAGNTNDTISLEVTCWKQMHTWDSSLRVGREKTIRVPQEDSATVTNYYSNTVFPHDKW